MSSGPRQPREKILRLLERIEAEIRPSIDPLVDQFVWAGSVRRQKPAIGDLDLVIRLRPGTDHQSISDALLTIAQDRALLSDGAVKKSLRLRGSGIKMEVYIARSATPDLFAPVPSDFGIILHTATGSLSWNVQMTRLAREAGLRYSPFTGLIRLSDGAVLPCETEEQLFAHLGLPFVDPTTRTWPPQ